MLTLHHPDLATSHRDDVEVFVKRQQALGNDVRWENYDLVFYRPDPRGVYSKDGAFRHGAFGFENRVPVSDDGTWEVDYRNVRRAKRTPRN